MDIIKTLPKFNTYTDSTKKLYRKIISNVLENSKAGDDIVKVIKNEDNTKFIDEFTSDYTKKLYYVLINMIAQKNDLNNKDYYSKKVEDLGLKIQESRGLNKNNKRTYTSWNNVYNIFDKISYKKLEDKLIIGLYTRVYNDKGEHWIFRNEPRTFKFGDNDNINNWIEFKNNKYTIYLNDYKTKTRYGQQIIPIIDNDLINVLELYLDNIKKNENLFPDNNSSWTQKLGRITKKYAGVKLTSQIIREIYESHLQNSEKYKKLNLNQKRRLHEMLFHDISTAMEYMKLNVH